MAQTPSDNHISGSNSAKPKKKFKFPDVYLPADVAKAVARKVISPTSFGVLMVVRALTLSKDWCWANNEYFATACRHSESEVSRNISELIAQGYLVQRPKKTNDPKRYLKLAWSWSLRKTANNFAENRKPTLRKTATINTVSETKEVNGTRERVPPPRLSDFSGDSKHLCNARSLKVHHRSERRQWLESPNNGAKHLRLLEEQDKQNYQKVLDWFCSHCGLADEKKYNLPSISSCKQFRQRYEWIKGCMERAKGLRGDPNKLRDDQIV